MTQVINKKLMKCCDQCHKYMNGACAWLSLGNEYCDEIMAVQQQIDQLTNNWNELEEWLKEGTEELPYINGDMYWREACENVLDKMKEIKVSDEE